MPLSINSLSISLSHKDQESNSLPAKICTLLELLEEKGLYLSFEDRVILDLAAIACTVVELCCNKTLRSILSFDTTLRKRFLTIRGLLMNGYLNVPW